MAKCWFCFLLVFLLALCLEGIFGSTLMGTAQSLPTAPRPHWLKDLWGHWLWPPLRMVLICYLCWCTFLFFLQDQMLFPRDAVPPASAEPLPDPAIAQVWLDLGKRVEGWYLPPLTPSTDTPANQKKPHPVVLFFHGNGELIEFCLEEVQPYRRWGMAVFLPEYRGYGRSGGVPSQKAIAADMRQFRQWLLQRPEIDRQRLIYHGRSLGGAVACQLAADSPPAALIIVSTFTRTAAMARPYLVPSFLLKHPFQSDTVISKLTCPIFVSHGTYDGIIPVSHGRQLAQLARKGVYYEVAAGHNDFPMDNAFWQKIETFLRNHDLL